MCEKSNAIDCLVLVPADLSHSERPYWKQVGIDSCIAPMVNALNRAGIYTASSCCGHGEMLGHIWLHDGRVIVILPDMKLDVDSSKDKLVEYLRIK